MNIEYLMNIQNLINIYQLMNIQHLQYSFVLFLHRWTDLLEDIILSSSVDYMEFNTRT